MDGVLVNSELVWEENATDFLENLYGSELLTLMGDMRGMSLDHEYAFAIEHGFICQLMSFIKDR